MSNSLIIRSPSIEVLGNRPKATRDPLIRPGTKFLYDWYRPRTHPTGAIVAGSVGTGATIGKNLGSTTVDAVAQAANNTVRSDGAITTSSLNASHIRIGTAGQFNMAAAPAEIVAIIWIALPSSYTATNFTSLMRLSSDSTAANAQVWFDMGVGGLQPRVGVMNSIYTILTNISLETIYQIALHYDPGGAIALYINGARIQGLTTGAPSSLTAAPSAFFEITSSQLKTFFRATLCDVDASIAAEQAAGYSSDTILTGPQMITQDYQFCMNQITAAPKTAFAW